MYVPQAMLYVSYYTTLEDSICGQSTVTDQNDPGIKLTTVYYLPYVVFSPSEQK
jgi:hypothetical protein